MVSMIDISNKASSLRTATAVGGIALTESAYRALKNQTLPKGDPLLTAKIAAIQSAKECSRILPLCHNIPLSKVEVNMTTFGPLDQIDDESETNMTEAVKSAQMGGGSGVIIESSVTSTGSTGVEMESLLATQIAALTIYDMTKGLGLGSVILPTVLMEKTGGQSGHYHRFHQTEAPSAPTKRFHSSSHKVEGLDFSSFAYGNKTQYPFRLPALPWGAGELSSGGISAETIQYHHKKHHQAYVTKLNALIASSNEYESLSNMTLEELIASPIPSQSMKNQACQVFNHALYWYSLRPLDWVGHGWSSALPSEVNNKALLVGIEREWHSVMDFMSVFSDEVMKHFGSGWVWLVQDRNSMRLLIQSTHDAQVPDLSVYQPLLVCDVWEHAYYIDHRNDRAKYLESFWLLVNWEFANSRLL